MFCSKCGKEIDDAAVVCVGCGCAVNKSIDVKDNRGLITILLCWFLGILGVHRFYTGHTIIGIIQATFVLSWLVLQRIKVENMILQKISRMFSK